jgi:hypothetical protein
MRDNIKQDICQLKIQNWIACVQDRVKWNEVVEKAKTFNQGKFSARKKKKYTYTNMATIVKKRPLSISIF